MGSGIAIIDRDGPAGKAGRRFPMPGVTPGLTPGIAIIHSVLSPRSYGARAWQAIQASWSASTWARRSRPSPPWTTAASHVTLPNRDGEMLTPSAVLLAGRRQRRGRPAGPRRRPGTARPRGHADQAAHGLSRLTAGPSPAASIGPKRCRPSSCASWSRTPSCASGPISKAVITVPAYFDDTPPQGHQGRRPHRRPGRHRHPRRADGGGPGLLVPAAARGRGRPLVQSPAAQSRPCWSTISAAAPST